MALNQYKLQLINEALSGFSTLALSSLTEESFDAQQAYRTWDIAVREMLSAHTWSFLLKNVALSDGEEIADFEYCKRYKLPDDVSKPVIVLKSSVENIFSFAYNYDRTAGNYLFSEYKIIFPYFYTSYQNPIYFVYMSNDVDNAFLTDNFKTALVYIMRRELSLTKKNSIAIHDRYDNKALVEKRKAIFEDLKNAKAKYSSKKDINYSRYKSI